MVRDGPTAAAAAANSLGKDILQYLRETVDWYRPLRLQEQIAIDSSDLTLLDDDRHPPRLTTRSLDNYWRHWKSRRNLSSSDREHPTSNQSWTGKPLHDRSEEQ